MGDLYVLRHIDCAQFYENEAEVGEGIRRSGIPRDQVFISMTWSRIFLVESEMVEK